MGKFIFLLGVLVIGFIAIRPERMPMDMLEVYSNQHFNDGKRTIGGPCIKEKCLTIYVAPWCPTCHALNPMIISLVQDLKMEGILVNVVVGKDSIDKVQAFAKEYPFPVLTDADGGFYYKAKLEGVPYFAVTNSRGEIINEHFGGYKKVSTMREKLEI